MNKALENEFFNIFGCSGVACLWLKWLAWKYDIEYKDPIGKIHQQSEAKFYDLFVECTMPEMPKIEEILSDHNIDLVFVEIKNNLEECRSEDEKERYVSSLIKPFDYFSQLYLPIAKINRLNHNIKEINGFISEIADAPADEILVSVRDLTTPVITVHDQLILYNKKIKDLEIEIDDIKSKRERLFKLIHDKNTPNYSYIIQGIAAFLQYYIKLDALLLTHYIDLMQLQKDYGVYFTKERFMSLVAHNVGTKELAQKYIDTINHRKSQQSINTYSYCCDEDNPKLHKKGRSIQSVRDSLLCEESTKAIELRQKKHFNYDIDKAKARCLHERLTKDRYLNAEFDDFYYMMCGESTFNKKIEWLKSLALLGYFIDNLFGDTNSNALWEITKASFIIKGKEINISSIKSAVSKYKNDEKKEPVGYKDLAEIIGSL